LPEYKSLIHLLEKGIGIHHSGMIPVLREIVELRISEKKIFMLFATESFAIGLDCPIRTAVFTGLTKFDGKEDRFLYAHEYTQMAGRAGRRGIDSIGHVIHLPLLFKKGMPSELAYQDILSNKPQVLISKFHIDYKMILSLLKKGICQKFGDFVEKSMTRTNLEREVQYLEKELEKLRQELMRLQVGLQHIRTPLDKCLEYEALNNQVKTAVNKKRKDIERKIAALKDQFKYIAEELGLVVKIQKMESDISEKEGSISETMRYLETQTNKVCDILRNTGVIEKHPETGVYSLTSPLGMIAAQFAEVHPIPLAKLLLCDDWFQGYTAKELVGVLSVFVDIRLPEQYRAMEPQCANTEVKNAIAMLQSSYESIREMELRLGCYTGIVYEGALCFDMTDAMMEWCDLTEEADCKVWLRDLVAGNVSAGDFAKACMKVSAIAKEIGAMCEVMEPIVGSKAIELLYVLSDVDLMILKHIATTQSLYL